MRGRDSGGLETTHHIGAGLRAFDGHFPGAPVLPGAYLLALVLDQLERQPGLRDPLGATLQVQQVKFLAPVGPGQTLRLRLEPARGGVGFSVHHGATLVARGQIGGGAESAAS